MPELHLRRCPRACILPIALLAWAAAAQSVTPRTSSASAALLKARDLTEDVAILRHAYVEMHPGLYRYNTPAQIDADFEELAAQLNHDRSLRDAYLAFSIFAAKIKCGHTYANFYNQPKNVVEELFGGQNRVPFYFEWIDAQMGERLYAGRTLAAGDASVKDRWG